MSGGGGGGDQNTAVGAGALLSNTIGLNNTATGSFALLINTTGGGNTAIGAGALLSNTTGPDNTANGSEALFNNTSGMANTAVGVQALYNSIDGSHNIALGYNAGFNVHQSTSDVICIGSPGLNRSNSCYIGQIFGEPSDGGIAVIINSDGKLGTPTSSRRFKKAIQPIGKASEAILALKPVTFHYKNDTTATPQFGLIAEEVAAVNPDLVVRDKEGKPFSVRYDQVNAMLLNEFLKEHRKVQEQETTIAQLKQEFQSRLADHQKQIKALASSLQEVSNQLAAASPSRGGLEASKTAPRTVLNNQ